MKHSAANTHVLTVVKKVYNDKIYKESLGIYNRNGQLAMFEYLQQYASCDIRQVLLQNWS